MGENMIVDLAEINKSFVAGLYDKLKLIDDVASPLNSFGEPKTENIAAEKRIVDRSVFFIDAPAPTTLREYCDERDLDRKTVLHEILDPLFLDGAAASRLNFGILMREYHLTTTDVPKLREYFLTTGSVITLRSIFNEFLYTASEIAILLAALYTDVDENMLKEQLAAAAAHIPLPDLLESLAKEFDETLESLQKTKQEKMQPVIASLDKSRSETSDEINLLFDNINSGLAELQREMEDHKAKVVDVEASRLAVEFADLGSLILPDSRSEATETNESSYQTVPSSTLSKFSSGHVSEVLPRLPVQTSSADTSGVHVTDIHQVDNQLQLLREPPAAPPLLAVGDRCLAKRGNYWVSAVLQEDTARPGQAMVKFNDTQDSCVLNKDHVAYASPPSWYMQIGDRVVAPFDKKGNGGSYDVVWCSAIVAEQPSISRNGGRYLLFNEFGDARYCKYTEIRCTWRQAKASSFWAEIADTEMREFLKQLMGNLPEKALVRLKPNQTVRMLYDMNGWRKCMVEEIDGVMAKLKFTDGRGGWRSEWFYRGDRRLEPIYEQHSRANRYSTVRRHSRLNGPVIEYVDDDSDVEEPQPTDTDSNLKKVPTARKSTAGRFRQAAVSNQGAGASAATSRGQELLRPRELVEIYRRTVNYQRKEASGSDRPLSSCDETCLGNNDNTRKYKNENPLLIPLLCGWQRLTERARTRKKIVYVPPCEHRRLLQERELQDFLRQTNCRLTIELFNFDTAVDPSETIRVIEPFVRIDDISYGRENVRIECVNGFNMEKPCLPTYEARRFTTDRTVDLEGAKMFISGCSCTDNCSDPKRCHCMKLTVQQATPPGKSKLPKYVGYRYRRLPDGEIATGIYECNQFCKCDCRCPNRVVQHPMMTRLQLFRTLDKGWGVRTLDDIPKGGFICIYAGNVLSDQAANEVGVRQGDEYFADLDLILCAEHAKEGYEEEVEEVEESDSEESRTVAKRRRERSVSAGSEEEDAESSGGAPSNRIGTRPSGAGSEHSVRPWLMSKYLGEDQSVFILDAKLAGNIGRYLNHSCSPNVFVQSVFVDTHDMRLPWVAFFSKGMIKAGAELCWDYRYTPMDDRPIPCNCGAPNCRKRLI